MNAISSARTEGSSSPAERPSYVRGMERLLHAVQELSLARSLADVQGIVRTAARELTGCDGATFVLRDEGKCYYADEDAIAPLWKGGRFPLEACISGWVMLNREPAVIPDVYSDARVPHVAYKPTFVKSLVMVPIRTISPVGAIGNYWADEHHPSGDEVSLLQALADSTSVAMENVQVYSELELRVRERTHALEQAHAEIRQLSVTDELTGLHNRRGFHALAEPALRNARRRKDVCLLAFIDVNGLKRVNDGHGHDVGDALIIDVARVLRSALRQSDLIARIGGDEFCVLAVDRVGDPDGLRARLQDAFDAHNRTATTPYRLSASIGIARARVDNDFSLDRLIARADELMYAEKKARL